MKKIALISPVIMIFLLSACSGSGPSKDGENQVPEPVQNSGAATEAARAVEAVKDTSKDSGHQHQEPNGSDTTKMSEPH